MLFFCADSLTLLVELTRLVYYIDIYLIDFYKDSFLFVTFKYLIVIYLLVKAVK